MLSLEEIEPVEPLVLVVLSNVHLFSSIVSSPKVNAHSISLIKASAFCTISPLVVDSHGGLELSSFTCSFVSASLRVFSSRPLGGFSGATRRFSGLAVLLSLSVSVVGWPNISASGCCCLLVVNTGDICLRFESLIAAGSEFRSLLLFSSFLRSLILPLYSDIGK